MRKATIVLVGIIVATAMTAAPATAGTQNTDEGRDWPCVDVSLDPVRVSVDPRCLEDVLPPISNTVPR